MEQKNTKKTHFFMKKPTFSQKLTFHKKTPFLQESQNRGRVLCKNPLGGFSKQRHCVAQSSRRGIARAKERLIAKFSQLPERLRKNSRQGCDR